MTDIERILDRADAIETTTISDDEKVYFIGYCRRGTLVTELDDAGTVAAWNILKIHEYTDIADPTRKMYVKTWANADDSSRNLVWAQRSTYDYSKFGY